MRGEWGAHKWDNPQVWVYLMNDLKNRGFFRQYYPELEYLFLEWGFGLSIRLLLQKGYILTKEELISLIDTATGMFPDIRHNQYRAQNQTAWNSLLVTLLDMEITEESAVVINDILKKYV